MLYIFFKVFLSYQNNKFSFVLDINVPNIHMKIYVIKKHRSYYFMCLCKNTGMDRGTITIHTYIQIPPIYIHTYISQEDRTHIIENL